MAHKYGARKTIIDNIRFDSKAEAMYYQQLKTLKRSKEILDFELQPEFELLKTMRKNGKTIRGVKYKADFKVLHLDGRVEIVDVKGVRTESYILKSKMFEHFYPELTITEVQA